MPPENSCGYWSRRARGDWTPTSARSSTARSTRLCLAGLRVQADRLDQLVPDRLDRVQRAERVLEDHRDPAAAHGAEHVVRRARLSSSSPSWIEPPRIRPGASSSPSTASATRRLARARTRRRRRAAVPAGSSSERPSTARTVRPSSGKSTTRSAIERTTSVRSRARRAPAARGSRPGSRGSAPRRASGRDRRHTRRVDGRGGARAAAPLHRHLDALADEHVAERHDHDAGARPDPVLPVLEDVVEGGLRACCPSSAPAAACRARDTRASPRRAASRRR